MRHSQLVESHVRAILVSTKVTDEGEIIPYHPTELKVGVDIEGEVDNILFLWPATVFHIHSMSVLDPTSDESKHALLLSSIYNRIHVQMEHTA